MSRQTACPDASARGLETGDWRALLNNSVTGAKALCARFPADPAAVARVAAQYPLRINPYFLSLLGAPHSPLARQAVPDLQELAAGGLAEDPLAEEAQSPLPGLTHRYPDRVIFLVSDTCAMYCRFCMRKRKVGQPAVVTPETVAEGLAYIERQPAVREVILSGGDPLLLSDRRLKAILTRLRTIPHVAVIRIHTRIPAALPQRITPALGRMLEAFHPLFINAHFNHPDEITPAAALACERLSRAGIPLGCQTVLLKGVNDDPATMTRLMQGLLAIRVKPYYLHHPDPVRGTAHFRVPVRTGLAIMAALRGHISGMGVPQYMIDLPGGGGKVPLLPAYVREIGRDRLVVRNYEGQEFEYPL